MQKKSLDNNIGVDDYNKKIFNKSVQLLTNCKKIPINQVSNLHRNQNIKKKYNAIEDKINSILKILRNFTQAQKPTFNNPIDLATEILEETKLKVDIQFRKAQQHKNTVKVVKNQSNIKRQRPQQQFPDIKPYENFNMHSHQNYLSDGIIPQIQICEKFQEASDMNNNYLYVDTIQKLNEAIDQMKNYSQVAVDVEHSQKSYQGFTCLIQMSTRQRDYIIDVFPIWTSVHLLKQIIGNPSILKVMHGAEMDTKWLQRDFNIHIINLFDTHKASRVLGLQRFSYAYLLQNYCNVVTDKKYQLEDWRVRPLTPQMLRYARMDTHYLLKIYDLIRLDLQNKSNQMNQNAKQVLEDIHNSSHEVTLANAILFSYKATQLYGNLLIQFQDKKEQFKPINLVFSQINQVAVREDQSFDDLILKKDLIQVISFIKDLLFNKKSKISKQTRIEKIVTILQRSNNPLLNQAINNIKKQLTLIFCQKQTTKQTQKLTNSMAELHIKQPTKPLIQVQAMQDQQETTQFTRQRIMNIKFNQFRQKSFKNTQQKIHQKILFAPISSFLSQKYGIEQVKDQQENVMEQQQEQQDEQQNQHRIQEENDGKQGIIEFKRMNPNVIYTIQQPDPEIQAIKQSQKPKKMRKQAQYQQRLKNKKGNIFDLLADN